MIGMGDPVTAPCDGGMRGRISGEALRFGLNQSRLFLVRFGGERGRLYGYFYEEELEPVVTEPEESMVREENGVVK